MATSGRNICFPKGVSGFSLIELLIIIIALGVMASVAVTYMMPSVEDIRRIKTEREMETLAKAIVGDPSLTQNSVRSDFGYVGDVGAFPPNLQALYQNPGSYATWDGPYIASGYTQDSTGFKTDEWGAMYSYSGGVTISSSGGGSAITKKIADASNDYLLNRFSGTVTDADGSQPGSDYADSVNIVVNIPDGTGGTTIKTYQPDANGSFTLDSLPVGRHPLDLVYQPASDTLHRFLTILPRHRGTHTYAFAGSYFGVSVSTPGITYVSNSDTLWTGGCSKLKFRIENNSGESIDVSSITLTWSSPTAYYKLVTWSGTTVRNSNPSAGSGEQSNFSGTQAIANGTQLIVTVEQFKPNPNGSGPSVDMTDTEFTVAFSDGSTFTFTADLCD